MRSVTILGSTGSIGTSTLDVIARHPDLFSVFGLSCFSRLDVLAAQVIAFRPRLVAVPDDESARELRERLSGSGASVEIVVGVSGLEQIASAPEVDIVMASVVGAAGLRPTLAAARHGKRVLLANKEALVVAGGVFMAAVRECGAELLPIDSEHNAIFQCLPSGVRCGSMDLPGSGVASLLLTASGGPFRTAPMEALRSVTPEQACAHPNWVMGRKISVDSATMMNKGLEVIEAHWLFGLAPENIEVVIHPQSVIHSMVRYADGSVLAQMGNPDMRTPIAYGLAYPERIEAGVTRLSLAEIGALSFDTADLARFPCLRLAFDALRAGQGACIALNAANEVAVEAFLERRLPFTRIAAVVEECLARSDSSSPTDSLEAVLAADARARVVAGESLERMR